MIEIFGIGKLLGFENSRERIDRDLSNPNFKYRLLTDDDVARSEEALAESKLQLERADKYTANLREATLNGAQANALFIERFGALRAEVAAVTEKAYIAVESREQQIIGELEGLRSQMKSIRKSTRNQLRGR